MRRRELQPLPPRFRQTSTRPRARSRSRSDEAPCQQEFENLHAVGCGAFAELVADAPQHELACRPGLFGAQASDMNGIGSLDITGRYDPRPMKDDSVGSLERRG